ncbi:hypothetical protein [Candidatus Uabimicrobium sp. HlEnr_7]|uniref:hypothetical protein n=1 Tax=Candidatus Uabimicrobium helgolandensis TaxID=3095367 RepID=UPI003555F40B
MNGSEKIKYLIHCLAFFCMPIIIIRGIEIFLLEKDKETPIVNFQPVKVSNTKTIWLGNISSKSQVILTPHSDTIELNNFNNDITNRFFKKKYKFYFLYIAHFGQQPLKFAPEMIKCIFNCESNSHQNQILKPQNSTLYTDLLLNDKEIVTGAVHKFLIGFDTTESMLQCKSVDLIWQKQNINMKKTICLRKTFNEFLAKPTFDFFYQENN